MSWLTEIHTAKLLNSTEEETDFINNSDWILLIMSLLETNPTSTNTCLKILFNASRKHKEVRLKLMECQIFHVLAFKIRKETDFWSDNLILYSALIVSLIQGNSQAQNQLRISGYLSSVLNILSSILDEADNEQLPYKSTELIIYTLIASCTNPHHSQNQTEIGWIIPKVLNYLEKQIFFSDSPQFQIIKSLWFFMKTVLEKNETNQYIFLKSSGVGVLFRSIQKVLKGDCDEKGALLIKMTGTLLKMRKDKKFLYQASHYCPVMILIEALKASHYLVAQQILIFFHKLSQEYPHTLQIMKTEEVHKQIKIAKLILAKSKTTAELCQHLWKRLELLEEVEKSQDCLSSQQSSLFGSKNNFNSLTTSDLKFLKYNICVIHDTDLENSQDESEYIFNTSHSVGLIGKNKNWITNKIRLLKGERRLNVKVMKEKSMFDGLKSRKRMGMFERFREKKIIFVFQKMLTYLKKGFNGYCNRKLQKGIQKLTRGLLGRRKL